MLSHHLFSGTYLWLRPISTKLLATGAFFLATTPVHAAPPSSGATHDEVCTIWADYMAQTTIPTMIGGLGIGTGGMMMNDPSAPMPSNTQGVALPPPLKTWLPNPSIELIELFRGPMKSLANAYNEAIRDQNSYYQETFNLIMSASNPNSPPNSEHLKTLSEKLASLSNSLNTSLPKIKKQLSDFGRTKKCESHLDRAIVRQHLRQIDDISKNHKRAMEAFQQQYDRVEAELKHCRATQSVQPFPSQGISDDESDSIRSAE